MGPVATRELVVPEEIARAEEVLPDPYAFDARWRPNPHPKQSNFVSGLKTLPIRFKRA